MHSVGAVREPPVEKLGKAVKEQWGGHVGPPLRDSFFSACNNRKEPSFRQSMPTEEGRIAGIQGICFLLLFFPTDPFLKWEFKFPRYSLYSVLASLSVVTGMRRNDEKWDSALPNGL